MKDELKTQLTELGLSEEQVGKLEVAGAASGDDIALLSADEIVTTTECGLIIAKKVAAAFAPATPEPTSVSMVSYESILPSVPDNEAWLKNLRAGGISKVEESTMISAVRAALGDKAGLFEIPKKLVVAMEAYTDETEEQVGEEFFEIRKLLTRADYGDLFAAIDGLDGTFVTNARKQELFRRINEHLWPSIVSFNQQLQSWQNAWMQGTANPMMMMSAFMSHGSGAAMPPGMMQPPDTGVLRDAAEAVVDEINVVFRGTGVQIAAALAYEANRIKTILSKAELPALTGAANREQMLKKLGASVPATYPRLETNLTQFVLGIMHAGDQPAGDEELKYFGALFMLGSQIQWTQIGVDNVVEMGGRAGIGGSQL